MLPWNHYEVAFRAFLQSRRIPFLAVQERQRCRQEDGSSIKSLDFVLSRPGGTSWLIDVKGRRFPSGSADGKRGGYWKHWSTRDDLVGIRRWERVFGEHYEGLFVFAYEICGHLSPVPAEQVFSYRRRLYGFVGITLADYLSEVRVLSPRWKTYAMPTARFKALARPFEEFLKE